MSDSLAQPGDIASRLKEIERELRWWRRSAIAGLAVVAVMLAGAMAEPREKELRVETLRIVDDEGKDRLVLTARKGIPDMTFLDPKGHTRMTLDIAEDERPVLVVSDSGESANRVSLGIDKGSPTVQLYDAETKKKVVLSVPKDLGALIRIFGEDGKLRSRFP